MFNERNDIGFKTFIITSQPFYDQYNQCYKNIMMVNIEPRGPLRQLVRRTKLPRLCPFSTSYKREGLCNPIAQCDLALQSLRKKGFGFDRLNGRGCCKVNSSCDLMTPDEIPDLITFLIGNGYQIETQITNMLNQSELKLSNRKLGFTITYYGDGNQPNITYMR